MSFLLVAISYAYPTEKETIETTTIMTKDDFRPVKAEVAEITEEEIAEFRRLSDQIRREFPTFLLFDLLPDFLTQTSRWDMMHGPCKCPYYQLEACGDGEIN
ncbi:unnamed protein product [Onchocerca flexuosa]|uniref:DUF2281 domain-containing protein n=1 Tax=Onchocerca flexuosa TaxID=387005 RepID=A0A183I7F3_9BILA|nr:unnamed protein product [Onchocerca flexuosa]